MREVVCERSFVREVARDELCERCVCVIELRRRRRRRLRKRDAELKTKTPIREKVVEAARRKKKGETRWWRITHFKKCMCKIVCDKVVCEGLRVTKWCRERLCETKLYVKGCV